MPLPIPDNATEVVQRAKVDVQRELPSANPFLRNSYLGALVTGIANRLFDFYFALRRAIDEALPDTAIDNLERWAAIWGITRTAATPAEGNVVATGTATTPIPLGTTYVDSSGKEYLSTAAATIAAKVVSVSSITRAGSTATVTAASPHGLASNVLVTIAGANETEYNVAGATIIVTGASTFTYQVTGTPATPATGTITAAFTTAPVPVRAVAFGASENQDADALLSLQSPIAGVDDDARVDFGEIAGGFDQEADDPLRARLLSRIRDPVSHFSAAEIDALAKTVAGVTRVFVEEITPGVGQVTVYFMRDDDDTPIPDGAEVAAVKAILETIRPANTDPDDLIVLAPTAVSTDFTFTDLQPNTSTMRDAVEASLEQFFAERTNVGQDVDSDAYRSAIFNTVDPSTGDEVSTFTLSAPVGDLTIVSGEIATLGNVTFP